MYGLLSFFTNQLQVILPLFFQGNPHSSPSFEPQTHCPEDVAFCVWRLGFKNILSVHGRRKQNGHQGMEKVSYTSETLLLPRRYFSLFSGGFWASVGSPSLLPCTLEGTSDNLPSSFGTNTILLSQHLENGTSLTAETLFGDEQIDPSTSCTYSTCKVLGQTRKKTQVNLLAQ